MSVTPQMTRNKTKSETPTSASNTILKRGMWNKSFPSKFSTETSSCTFVKKLVTVAVSNITYLRTIFPEVAYANKSLDGLPIKVLKAKNECPGALKVANWLLGAFDALEKKYLKELILFLYKDKTNPDIVEEMYTFKFSYPEGQTTCQLLQGKEKVKRKISDNDVYNSTQDLLRTLVILTQTMNPLSGDTSLSMKLTYYDEMTPEDYEPAGFIPTPLIQPQLPAGSSVLQSGQVSTLYHSVHLGVQAAVGPGDTPEYLPPYQQGLVNHEPSQDSRQSLIYRQLQGTSFTPSSSSSSRSVSAEQLKVPSSVRSQSVLSSVDLGGIVDHIKSGKARNIITMAGAGISTSAGIPDFRTPGTGLYDNLQKYDLPDPMAIFDISFFSKNPKPFLLLAKELYPGKFEPTASHHFIKLLEKKSLLLRHFTQNIDNLERIAGISDDKLVEAHGAFHTGHCIKCRKEYSQDWLKEIIFEDEIPTCDKNNCGGFVKPDIVFFGEQLPSRYYQCLSSDFEKCDLLIILGTSLVVQPFASLIDKVNKDCPRLLINMEKAGVSSKPDQTMTGRGLQMDKPGNFRDVAWLGDCDKGCKELAKELGWGEELKMMIEDTKQKE